ncbi:MAG: hypothetical protein JST84_05160 [Acidobacteria bacterium]|nr:hypothetical protein [Acidobacteriota bacterium]
MHKIFSSLSLFLLLSVSAFAHTIYRPSSEGSFDVKVEGALNASLKIEAPDWAEVVTSEISAQDNLKVATLTVNHASTVNYRTGTITVLFGISEYKFEIVQAGSLQISIHPEAITTEQIKKDDIIKAWVVPDNTEVLPTLRFYPTRAGVIFEFEFQSRPGWLYVQTATALYSARLTYP